MDSDSRTPGSRRDDLVRAAAEIVRSEGFQAVSVKAVTARAGMSTGLLYRYASNIEELLAEVFRTFAGTEFAAVVEAVQAEQDSAAARLSTLVEVFSSRALRGPTLAWALLVEPVDQTVGAQRLRYRSGYADLVTEIIEDGIAAGELPAQDARITAAALVGAIGEALAGELSPIGEDSEPGPIIESIRALCLRAAGADTAGAVPAEDRGEGAHHEHA